MAENASNELHFLLGTEFFVFDPYVVHQAKRNGEVFPNFTQVPVAHKSFAFERGVSGRLLWMCFCALS